MGEYFELMFRIYLGIAIGVCIAIGVVGFLLGAVFGNG